MILSMMVIHSLLALLLCLGLWYLLDLGPGQTLRIGCIVLAIHYVMVIGKDFNDAARADGMTEPTILGMTIGGVFLAVCATVTLRRWFPWLKAMPRYAAPPEPARVPHLAVAKDDHEQLREALWEEFVMRLREQGHESFIGSFDEYKPWFMGASTKEMR